MQKSKDFYRKKRINTMYRDALKCSKNKSNPYGTQTSVISSARGKPINVTKEWINAKITEQNDRCARTGMEFFFGPHEYGKAGHFGSPSLDRIDNNRGYETDNIEIVCSIVNKMKSCWDHKDILPYLKGYVKKNES